MKQLRLSVVRVKQFPVFNYCFNQTNDFSSTSLACRHSKTADISVLQHRMEEGTGASLHRMID